jgi:hypothetical protein
MHGLKNLKILEINKMEHYNFSETDKLIIAEDDLKDVLYFCPNGHGIYMKYKKATSSTCPFCNKSNDPIQDVRELRKKFKRELNII